jgi:HK97 family phage portal protein
MTWLQALRGETRSSLENPSIPITSQTLVDMLVGPPADSGVHVSEKSALAMPAVYRAVALLSGTVASLPLHAYEEGADDTRRKVPAEIVDAPHPDLTRFEWLELALVHNLSWGNTYFRTLRDQTGKVTELWPIEPSRVRVGRAKSGHKVYAVSTTDLGSSAGLATGQDLEDRLPFTDREILHVPGLGYDGTVGLSPIALARQGIGLAIAAERYGAKLFGSGNLLTGILTTDQKLSQDQAEVIKSRWKAQHSGLDAAHDIGVLGQGTKFQSITVPPEDAQFIESRRFQIAEVARIYGVPPHMLMDTERSTSWGTGIEQQSIGFVVWTLRPWLLRFEQRLSRLLPAGQFVKFNVEGLLRGDSVQRAQFYKGMWDLGAFSTNEIRALEDRPPVEGGDVRYRPLNMGVLGEPDPAPAPAPTDQPEPPAPLPDPTEEDSDA